VSILHGAFKAMLRPELVIAELVDSVRAIFFAKDEAISEPTRSWDFLATTMVTVLDFGVTLTEKSGLPQSPAFAEG